MSDKLSKTNQFSPVFRRLGCITVLMASGTGVISSVIWIYHRVHYGLGLDVAAVVVAFLSIVILGLILVGFGAGYGLKRALRRRQIQALKIYRLLKWSAFFQEFWRYIGPPPESEKTVSASPPRQGLAEITVTPGRPAKRGRIPTYSMDRWIKVVSAWENRDTWRNPITLEEFLSQEFGTCADGSPKISTKTYYDWRKRVHAETHKQQTMEKEVSS